MDITILFKASIKKVRTINKNLSQPDNSILKSSIRRDEYLQLPKTIVKEVSGLQKFFLDNRAAYLNVVNYLSTKKTMTEADRAAIDTEAQRIISICTNLINDYKKQINMLKKTSQMEEHYGNIVKSLENYLKEVSTIYTEAKAVRVKKVIEVHKISKLEGVSKKDEKKEYIPPSSPLDSSIENELSVEEMQMFETENDMLYNELNSISDEVKQMESKVVHIAELQEMFTEKVLQQEKDIDRIANVVTATTDNMKDANEQIRQAMQRNAGLRVYVLFFLLVLSFSLLFLDWYND